MKIKEISYLLLVAGIAALIGWVTSGFLSKDPADEPSFKVNELASDIPAEGYKFAVPASFFNRNSLDPDDIVSIGRD